jgi:Uncharacterised nucleotidyltransferase
MDSMLWSRVGALADRASCLSDLRHHKLQLIAASRMRERGQAVPPELRHAERHAAAITLSKAEMIRLLRDATGDTPFLVMKGPEMAARWPNPRLRPWKDLDVLVEDAEAFQAALLRAGFVEVGDIVDYADSHHLRPLAHPRMPMSFEIHRRPKWPTTETPPLAELFESAVPASIGIPGVLAPSPAQHAVLLAGHAWEDDPLSSIGLLADIAALILETSEQEIDAVARSWGIGRVWSATARAADQLLLADKVAARPPIWRRHLYETRERTVFEGHVERLVGPVAAAPVCAAPVAATRALLRVLRPWPGETWGDKLGRSRQSLRHASLRESEHDQKLFGPTA